MLVSTYGDGKPPDLAANFYEFLHSRKAPKLEGVKFAVLGLGDSTYVNFCQTGKDFDTRLEALGAERIHERAVCDLDYRAEAGAWIETVLGKFTKEMKCTAESSPGLRISAGDASSVLTTQAGSELIDFQHPFPAPILDSIVLNGRGSDKETRHIELSLEGSGLVYEPGDSLGVVAENDPAVVDELIQALRLKPEEPVPDGAGDVPLAMALARHYEITTVTPRFVERYAEVADAAQLRTLVRPDRTDLFAYLHGRHIIDVVEEFPSGGFDGKTFVGMLRKLQPRLYSLASSPAAYPGEAHLAVAIVRYQSHGRIHKGVASSYLAERRSMMTPSWSIGSATRTFACPRTAQHRSSWSEPALGSLLSAPFFKSVRPREALAGVGYSSVIVVSGRTFSTRSNGSGSSKTEHSAVWMWRSRVTRKTRFMCSTGCWSGEKSSMPGWKMAPRFMSVGMPIAWRPMFTRPARDCGARRPR